MYNLPMGHEGFEVGMSQASQTYRVTRHGAGEPKIITREKTRKAAQEDKEMARESRERLGTIHEGQSFTEGENIVLDRWGNRISIPGYF